MENLKSNNQGFETEQRSSLQVMTPNPHAPSPRGLEDRMAQHSPKSSGGRGKIIMIITLVFLLVIGGVGGWWYYAYGQALMMLNQARWVWGVEEGTVNFQQTTSLSLEIKNQSQDTENMYAMLLGGDKFNLDASADSKVLGENADADIKFSLASGDVFNINVGAKIKVVDKKVYLSLDAGSLDALLGSIFPISEFEDTWLEMDLEAIDEDLAQSYNYNVTMTEDQRIKVAELINKTFEELRNRKVFAVKDLKNDVNGFRKIQLTPKEDKLADIMIVFANFGKDTVELFSPDTKLEPLDEEKVREALAEDIEKMKTEKPEEWEKIKNMFASVNIIILINPDNKAVQGFELYIDNLVVDSGGSKTVINGNFKQLIKAIDYYEIIVPENVKPLDEIRDLYTNSMMGGESIHTDTIDFDDQLEIPDGLDNNRYDFICNQFKDNDEKEYCYYTFDVFENAEDIDTDEDGLVDAVEESIFYTDKNNSDSDGDGYLDGEEVANGYNPTGEGLLDSPIADYVEFLELARFQAKTTDIKDLLAQVTMAVVICQDYMQNIQYMSGMDCNGLTIPQIGELMCPSMPTKWPDVSKYNFNYIPCSSDYKNFTWQYGATNGEATIICDELGCKVSQ